jgi:hypothetical protein
MFLILFISMAVLCGVMGALVLLVNRELTQVFTQITPTPKGES